MPVPFDNIVQHLFHQPSLLSVTVDELERMTQHHPYFAAAHFLLLKKMQDTAHPEFNTQLHKTTLYFNNPLWLQFLLQPHTVSNFTVSDKAPFIAGDAVDELSQPAETGVHQNHFNEQAAQEEHSAVQPATDLHNAQNSVSIAEAFAQNLLREIAADEIKNNAGEPPAETTYEEQLPLSQTIHESIAASLTFDQPSAKHSAEKIDEEQQTVNEITHEPIAEPVILDQPADEQHTETINEDHQPVAETIHESTAEPVILDQPAGEQHTETINEDQHTAAETMHEHDNTSAVFASSLNEEVMDKKIAEELSSAKTIIETPAAKNDLLFEPYHTVDYFASQGIKLSKAEANSKDRLGTQLRSFTEWLKTMKKLPKVSVDKILAENEESKVVADANHSVETKEVITEAMAEVFEKQGLQEKAAEVYRKLSLQNPAKSVYFAARIEALKHN